ncbi:hypothetical protein [Posidoniimonas corsicana]|uniref:hypothetical protein n=1 Tax=Posidoniimonas corsicana TaxID=1938618 RepID=UPI0011B820F0|nr:hypothetical protein [Posidoniimonas corsicana]
MLYEDGFISAKVAVPRKCVSCVHLQVDNVHGFHCLKDADKWGHFHRGLDWGSWRPDHVYLQLAPPKVTTKALSDHAFTGNQLAFIKEHRRINPGLSIREAKSDYEHFRRVIEQIDPR